MAVNRGDVKENSLSQFLMTSSVSSLLVRPARRLVRVLSEAFPHTRACQAVCCLYFGVGQDGQISTEASLDYARVVVVTLDVTVCRLR